jgi:hypothetical protein
MSANSALGRQWGDVTSAHPEMEEHADAVRSLAYGTAADPYTEMSNHTEHDLVYDHRNVPLGSIRHNPDHDNPRTSQAARGYAQSPRQEGVGRLAAMNKATQQHPVPPVLLVQRGGGYEVADGHHRVTAARQTPGATHINAVVTKSPLKDRYGKGWE